MGHKYKHLALTALLSISVTACGASKADNDAKKSQDTIARQAPSSSVPAGAPDGSGGGGQPGSGTQVAPNGSPGANNGGNGSTGTSGGTGANEQRPPIPMKASLRSTCIKAGGEQSIRIEAPHMSAVGYDSVYPDGKSGISDGYYGGSMGGHVPEDGVWAHTWTVAPNAPPGKVRVVALGSHVDYESAEIELFFDLVPPTGTCA